VTGLKRRRYPTKKAPSAEDVRDAALRFLSYRSRSEAEVRRRLSRRFPASLIEGAIADLKEQGLLDDAAFARLWRQSREERRPRGASAIRWELLRMGVSREVAEEALEGLDEEGAAHRAGKAMLRRLGRTEYDVFREKLAAHLHQRGFGAETIRKTVRRLWEELSDPLYSHEDAKGHDEQQDNDTDGRRGH
jgi:regulatory protein